MYDKTGKFTIQWLESEPSLSSLYCTSYFVVLDSRCILTGVKLPHADKNAYTLVPAQREPIEANLAKSVESYPNPSDVLILDASTGETFQN